MERDNKYPVPLSREIEIGSIRLGAGNPVLVQSMTNTKTDDIPGSIAQFKRIADAGGQMIRFATPGLREVKSLSSIMTSLEKIFPQIPVVADVHFNANVAFEAAGLFHKVRINPGNFSGKKDPKAEYSDEDYLCEYEESKASLLKLIEICKTHDTALRIGVNHGSLSGRIMSRFGDTPEGMVESAMEFLRVCKSSEFHNVVVSLKSSNTMLMVFSVRLLAKRMIEEDLYYPLHLGVTESGDGLEGRVRSVVGIAALLLEGFGDTIRISLTEPPENEIPVARYINRIFPKPGFLPYDPLNDLPWDPFHFKKPASREVFGIGKYKPPVVISTKDQYEDPLPDITVSYESGNWILSIDEKREILYKVNEVNSHDQKFILLGPEEAPEEIAGIGESMVIVLDGTNSTISAIKNWMISYYCSDGKNPLILRKEYSESDQEKFAIMAAGEFGLLLIDHLLSGIWIQNPNISAKFNNWLSFFVLQASRNRFTSTEYIACPSCGRTLFDISTRLSEVRKHTAHLKGLKIAVMGCIVNGPGEMADADYGYIGSGKGLVSIYKGKEQLKKKIPESLAVDALIQVIKSNGDWVDP